MPTDTRLIEDYIPIEDISAEARREKSIRKGHISTLHLWWARRPLVAARAAVYGVLVPAPKDKKERRAADEFVKKLCKYPGSPEIIKQAQRNILQAHAERLTAEGGEQVTVEDIEAGRAPRPKVLDMFAGGGAIPLEALRLGCESYALDLNPVAHLIELCTLVYPQQYGAPDPSAVGCLPSPHGGGAGGGVGTWWAGLAAEVEHWGNWVLEKVRAEIGDLYPPIPDPEFQRQQTEPQQLNMNLAVQETKAAHSKGMLIPIAYLWTRTVTCKNPNCGATVPLARQTWLAKKKGRFVALQPVPDVQEKRVRYRVVQATTEKGLSFDPSVGSKAGNAACPFCGTVADSTYVKAEGKAGRIGVQPMAVVCTRPKVQGKVYLAVDEVPANAWPSDEKIRQRIRMLESETANYQAGSITAPDELIVTDAKGSAWVILYGFVKFGDLFTPRQLLTLLNFAKYVRLAHIELVKRRYSEERAKATVTYLGLMLSRLSDFCSALCTWNYTGGRGTAHAYTRQALPMVWDFAETNPFNSIGANWQASINAAISTIKKLPLGVPSDAKRGSATNLSSEDDVFDAIVTDPPYYDNVAYADLSDFFYVWLKRSIGFLYPEHFASSMTPKKSEAVADATRHDGNRDIAAKAYEEMMSKAFAEAGRVLKPFAPLIIVYAHKTTLGWATLVDALKSAGFTVTEAWPLDTERSARIRAIDTASLASSIFLVARCRENDDAGSYERDVRPELQSIVRERLERLWAQGVTGADLVIACVGAGLRAFTKYARVEYANGEPVPADTFLAEVEGAVLEALLEKLFGVASAGIGGIDPVTRFYVLWRYAYRGSALDAGEAIVFAYPQRVELEGPGGLTSSVNPLVVKNKSRYLLRDFSERGSDEELGLPSPARSPKGVLREGAGGEGGLPSPSRRGAGGEVPLIDVLHRLLWLVENRPALIPAYLDEARPDIERLRLVAQTLGGHTLEGNGSGGGRSLVAARGAEASALHKLTTNWRTLIEAHRGDLM